MGYQTESAIPNATSPVIASAAKQSSGGQMDCFAALAMTITWMLLPLQGRGTARVAGGGGVSPY